MPKLKAFADEKFNEANMKTFVFGVVENIVEKEDNAVYQYLLLY